MQYTTYIRKPFVVEGIEITKDNIADLARYIGDLEYEDDGSPYILVDARKVPNVKTVYPGFFMTRMGKQIRVFSPRLFQNEFMLKDDTVEPWLEFIASKKAGNGG